MVVNLEENVPVRKSYDADISSTSTVFEVGWKDSKIVQLGTILTLYMSNLAVDDLS